MGVSVTRIVKYILKGDKGDSAVNYYITLSAKTFAADSAGKPLNTTESISVIAYKQVGNNSAVALSTANGDNWNISTYIRKNESNVSNYVSSNNDNLYIPAPGYAFNDIGVTFSVAINGTSQVYQQELIQPLKQGAQGNVGAALRGPQAWSDCAAGYSFQAGGQGDTWKDVVLYSDNYYSCVKNHTKTATNYPGSTEDSNNGYWQLGDKIELVATKILLATYALVKNLGVEAIDMKDSSGNIIFQAKDGSVVCKTGTFENITFSGTMNGVSGSFKSLDCVNESGAKVGGIRFGSDGKMWFEGDLYNQGYDHGLQRGYRFYSADLWCRGQFGASERNVLVVNGSYGYYYTKGMSYSGTYVAFTKKTSSNNTGYYVLPMNGTSGDYAGFPVDVVVFNINSSTVYNYELSMYNSQRVLVVNANDDQNNVMIFSNGNLVTWHGGEMGEVIMLANVMRPTPASTLVGCGLMVGAFRDNNW